MKINELEEEINGLEDKIKALEKEKEKIEENKSICWENVLTEVGEAILNKYLKQEEYSYFRGFYEIEEKLNKEYKKEERDEEKIKELSNERRKLKETIYKFVFDRLKEASDEEKIVAGEYLFYKHLFYSCGMFGSFKNPTTCGACHEGKAIVDKLGLREYLVYLGDRQYTIPKETKEKALENLGKETIKEKITKMQQNLESVIQNIQAAKEEMKNRKEKLKAYKKLELSGTDYEAVEEKMPDFFEEIMRERGRSGVEFALADIKENVGVILTNDWYYSGSGGCEYGVTVIVYRDGNTKEEYFKYRDAYDYRKDDFRYAFNKARITKITDKEVEIELETNRGDVGNFKIRRTFSLARQNRTIEEILSEEQQKEFQEKISKVEKELLQRHEKPNATMPAYVSLGGIKGQLPYGLDMQQSVPYENPETIDKYVDVRRGIAAIVIKAQIDHCASRGKQYEWVGYVIRKDKEPEMVSRECAYQLALKEGKKIQIKARDLVK
ncbi:MAG: hypothetical protein N3G19_01380 [Candidatus Pacearchaeota archaeon]|nr:hypothetical protein [Candidatus Pacearchaeota archaeon]